MADKKEIHYIQRKIKSHNWFVAYIILYSDEINFKHIHKFLKNKNKSMCEYTRHNI